MKTPSVWMRRLCLAVAACTVLGALTATASAATFGAMDVTGSLRARALASKTVTASSYTCTSADFGRVIFLAPTASTQAVTLPANGAAAGSMITFILRTDYTVSVAAATTDTLITNGYTDAKSVTFETSSHKIGSALLVVSTGSYWLAINLGDTTMTVNP